MNGGTVTETHTITCGERIIGALAKHGDLRTRALHDVLPGYGSSHFNRVLGELRDKGAIYSPRHGWWAPVYRAPAAPGAPPNGAALKTFWCVRRRRRVSMWHCHEDFLAAHGKCDGPAECAACPQGAALRCVGAGKRATRANVRELLIASNVKGAELDRSMMEHAKVGYGLDGLTDLDEFERGAL